MADDRILIRIGIEGDAEIKKKLDDVKGHGEKFGKDISKSINESVKTNPALGKAFGAEENLEKSRVAVERFRESIHALHPLLGAAGLEIGGLGSYARLAGAGMTTLGAVIAGSVLIGLAKIAEQADRTGARLKALSGSSNAFADLSKQAKELGINVGDLAPISEASLKYVRQLRADQAQSGGISHPPGYVPGAAEEAASGVRIFNGSNATPGGIPSDRDLETFQRALIEGSRIDHTPKDDAIAGIRSLQDATFKSGQATSQDIKNLQNVSPSLAQEVAKGLSGPGAGGLGRNFANPEELTAFLDKGGGKLSTPQLIAAVTKAAPGIHERAESVPPGITEGFDHLEAAAKHLAEAFSGDGGIAGAVERLAKYIDNFIGDHSKEKAPQSLGEVFTSDKGDLLGRLVGYLRGKNIPDLVANGPEALRKSPSEVFPDLQKNENKLLRGDFSNAYTSEPKPKAPPPAPAIGDDAARKISGLGDAAEDAAAKLRRIKSGTASPPAAAEGYGAPASSSSSHVEGTPASRALDLKQSDGSASAAPTSGSRIVPKFNDDGSPNPYGGLPNNRPNPDDGYTHPFAEAPHNEAQLRQQKHESAAIGKHEQELQKQFNQNIRDQNGGDNPSPDKNNYAPPTLGHYDPSSQNFVADRKQPARDPNQVPGAPQPTTFPTYQRELSTEFQGKYGPSGNPPGVENPFTAPPTVQPAPGSNPGDGPLVRVPIYGSDRDQRSDATDATKGILDLGAAAEAVTAKLRDEAAHAAGGGHIRGPGTSTSDDIPAMLSDGEYVIKAEAVKNIGVDRLDAINSGKAHFADGGVAATGGGYSGIDQKGHPTYGDLTGNLSITYDPDSGGAFVNGNLYRPGNPILNNPQIAAAIERSKADMNAGSKSSDSHSDPFGGTGRNAFSDGGLVKHFAEGGLAGSSSPIARLREVISRHFANGGVIDVPHLAISGMPSPDFHSLIDQSSVFSNQVTPGALHPVSINFNGQQISGLMAPPDVVKELQTAAIQAQTFSTGKKPGWWGGGGS
jgi:hypothetical protein